MWYHVRPMKRECVKVYLTPAEASELRARAGHESLSSFIRRQALAEPSHPPVTDASPIRSQAPAEPVAELVRGTSQAVAQEIDRKTGHPADCPCFGCVQFRRARTPGQTPPPAKARHTRRSH